VEFGVVVIAFFAVRNEVLTGLRRSLAVQFQVELSEVGVDSNVAVLLDTSVFDHLEIRRFYWL
jgi:hypothetical protein